MLKRLGRIKMLKKIISFALLTFAVLAPANAQEDCTNSYICTTSGCNKVKQCTPASAGGIVITPSTPGASYRAVPSDGAATNITSTTSSAQTTKPISPYSCAENGSCYGDVSAATGREKTVPVQGYYRRDGTYVRGHYRSKGN